MFLWGTYDQPMCKPTGPSQLNEFSSSDPLWSDKVMMVASTHMQQSGGLLHIKQGAGITMEPGAKAVSSNPSVF